MPAAAAAIPRDGPGRIARDQYSGQGLTIALSAAQLAAVLEQETIEPGGTIGNRLIGGLRVLGCVAEGAGAAALLAAPEPTMLTKVGGGALAIHAADQCSTGARQIWTGRDARSLTERGVTGLARNLGASQRTAENIGMTVEILVPIGGAALAGAIRAGAIRAGRITLMRHEAEAIAPQYGGHTFARHVGRTEAQLRQRLLETAAQRRAPAMISTFDDLATAERTISRALQVNRARIVAWSRDAGRGNLAIDFAVGREIGFGVARASGQASRLSSLRVVLKKEVYNGMPHFILTAFPK